MTWIDILTKIVVPVIVAVLAFILGRIAHRKDHKEAQEDRQKEKADEALVKERDQLRNENERLKAENAELRKGAELSEEVEPSTTGNYLIRKKDSQAICPICWAKDHKAVPIYENDVGKYRCGGCGHYDDFDRVKHQAHDAKVKAKSDAYSKQINDIFGFGE